MIRRLCLISFIGLSILMLLSACSILPGSDKKGIQKSEAIYSPVPINSVTPEVQASVDGSNSLGYALLKTFSADENTLLSPTSLSTALAMLQNGAEGDTLKGILLTMGESTDTEINARYNGLLSSLSKSGDKDDESAPTIMLGNSFWIRDTLTPKQPFVDALTTYFNADVFKADFSSSDTIDQINNWVEDQTNGLLKDTLDKIAEDTIAYLMNTVYFKGTWLKPYPAERTYEDKFYPLSGQSIAVQMMHQTNDFNYFENNDVQIAAFPYQGGLTMKVVLPKEHLDGLLENTSFDTLWSWLNETEASTEKLNVTMPKFDYDVKNSLSDPLKALGMKDAFDQSRADFSSLIEVSGENVYVSEIFQNCKIINDEKGTEAAAVTVVEIVVTSAPIAEDPPIDFNCNKPFMYLIEDDATGAVLFMGTVMRP